MHDGHDEIAAAVRGAIADGYRHIDCASVYGNETQIGQVLAVYRAGELVFDKLAQSNVRLPDKRSGLAMVFEAFEKASYVIILKARGPLKVGDKVKNP